MTTWQKENVFIKRILTHLLFRVRRNRLQIRLPVLSEATRQIRIMRENQRLPREANLADRDRNPLPGRAANRPAVL